MSLFSSFTLLPRPFAARSNGRPLGELKDRVLDELRTHTGHDANPDLISAAGAELCCCCGRATGVQALEPVSQRSHYVDGIGQFCRRCWQSLL